MPYNDINNKATIKYKKLHQKTVEVSYKIDYYEERILPVVNEVKLQPQSFFKRAIESRLDCEKLIRPLIKPSLSDTPQEQEEFISNFIFDAVKEKIGKEQ